MKTEKGLKKRLLRVHGLPISLPNCTIYNHWNRWFPVLSLLLLIAGYYSCSPVVQTSSGSGTSTEVVGRIVSPDNKAVEDVQVLLFDTLDKGTNSFVDTIVDTTDNNGNFKLLVDSSGFYLLTVKDTIGRSYMDEVVITDYDNPSLSLGTLTVDTMGSLKGFIYDNTNFKANITVILYKKDMPFMYLWRRGAFTIDSLAPGDVRIQVGGWIDDYSRVNKWIIFFDSTIQINPGRETVIDTVFINEETLLKAEGLTMGTCGQAPAHLINGNDNKVLSARWLFYLAGRIHPYSPSPFPVHRNRETNSTEIAYLFTSDKTAGAAEFRFVKSDIYAIPDGTGQSYQPPTGAAYYSLI